jgi:hypothetical protein
MNTNNNQTEDLKLFIVDTSITEGFSIKNNFINKTAFYTNRLGKTQPPILVVTPDGEFHWDKEAASRIDMDDFEGYESLRYILKTLWDATNKNVKTNT